MHLHLRWQYLVVVFPSSSGSLENSENPDLSFCIAPESTENKNIYKNKKKIEKFSCKITEMNIFGHDDSLPNLNSPLPEAPE